VRLQDYATIVFDCDGVILDSNAVKTEAFRIAAAPWGRDAAEALAAYHVANGGISRYAKFTYFTEQIVPELAPGRGLPDVDDLLADFSAAVREGLSKCCIAEGLESLRSATINSSWLLVSGGDQNELRQIFRERGLADYFDGGIFGSPDDKTLIFAREVENGNISHPAVYLGDSKYDYASASGIGLDFVFISGWSEVEDWQNFVSENALPWAARLSDLGAV